MFACFVMATTRSTIVGSMQILSPSNGFRKSHAQQHCRGMQIESRSIKLTEHKPKPKLKRTSRKKYKNDKFYHSKQWEKLRKMHLVQEPFCRSCKARGIYKAARS